MKVAIFSSLSDIKGSKNMFNQKQRQLIAAIILAFAGGCVSPTESPHEIDFFDPGETGTHGRPIPSGERSPEAYPWAGIDKNIVFHSLEESEATKAIWKPLYRRLEEEWQVPLEQRTWAWSVHLVTRLNQDDQARPLNLIMLRHRGVFYGLGGPMLDSKLHMFECTGEAKDAVYLLDDIMVECKGGEGLVYYFPTVELEREWRPQEPRIAPRWYRWWGRLFAHGLEALTEQEPGAYLPVDIYIYASRENVGVRSTRQLKVACGFHTPFGFPEAAEYWHCSTPSTEVPPEHCKNPLNRKGECEVK
jgi:hypothetical protein